MRFPRLDLKDLIVRRSPRFKEPPQEKARTSAASSVITIPSSIGVHPGAQNKDSMNIEGMRYPCSLYVLISDLHVVDGISEVKADIKEVKRKIEDVGKEIKTTTDPVKEKLL